MNSRWGVKMRAGVARGGPTFPEIPPCLGKRKRMISNCHALVDDCSPQPLPDFETPER